MISARGLTKRYGAVLAVDDLSFDVTPGAVTGFLGANGAGRSTTMRMMLGLDAPTAGSVTVAGRAYRDHGAVPAVARRRGGGGIAAGRAAPHRQPSGDTGRGVDAVPAAEVVSAGLLGVDAAAIVLMVLGASVGGSEYATGLAQPTFLVMPRRGRVVLAKIVVTASVAGAVAAAAAVLCPLVAQLVLVGAGLPPAPVDGALLRLVAGSALGPVFYALVALAAALVIRSTGGGVVVALAVLALPTVTSWVPGLDVLAPVWPGAALHGVSGVDEHVGAGVGALSLLAWAAAATAVAVWQVRVRDV